MGHLANPHSNAFLERIKQENRYLATQMAELYGRRGEKLRVQAGLEPPFGDLPWAQPHLRRTATAPALPRGVDPGDLEFSCRGTATMTNWDPSLSSAYGFAPECPAHRTLGGVTAHLRPKTGASVAASSAARSSRSGGGSSGRAELTLAWEAAPPQTGSTHLVPPGSSSGSAGAPPRTAQSGGQALHVDAAQASPSSRRGSSHRSSVSRAASSVVLRREVERAVRQAMAAH